MIDLTKINLNELNTYIENNENVLDVKSWSKISKNELNKTS